MEDNYKILVKRARIDNQEIENRILQYKPRNWNEFSQIKGINEKNISNFEPLIKRIEENFENKEFKKDLIINRELIRFEKKLINFSKKNKNIWNYKSNINNYSIFNIEESEKQKIDDYLKKNLRELKISIFDNNFVNKKIKKRTILKYNDDLEKNNENIKKDQLENNEENTQTNTVNSINFFSPKELNFNHFKKMEKQREKIFNEIGTNNLYLIPYYFLSYVLKNGSKFSIRAPIFLVPINLKLNQVKNSVSLSFDKNRDVILNSFLLEYIIKVEKSKFEYIYDYKLTMLENIKKIFSLEKNYITKKMINFLKDYDDKIMDFESIKSIDDTSIQKTFTIGFFDKFDNDIKKDLVKIRKNKYINKQLISLNDDNIVYSHQEKSFEKYSIKGNETKNEENIFYLNKLNYSQFQTLKKINEEGIDSLVIHGPPGTGKSQTIISLIIDAILKNKSVALVSEKKAALDVVYDRLENLQKYSFMFTDLNNKNSFYQQLRSTFFEVEKNENKSILINRKLNKDKLIYNSKKIGSLISELDEIDFTEPLERQNNQSLYQVINENFSFINEYIKNINNPILNSFKYDLTLLSDFKKYDNLNISEINFAFDKIINFISENRNFKELFKLEEEFYDRNPKIRSIDDFELWRKKILSNFIKNREKNINLLRNSFNDLHIEKIQEEEKILDQIIELYNEKENLSKRNFVSKFFKKWHLYEKIKPFNKDTEFFIDKRKILKDPDEFIKIIEKIKQNFAHKKINILKNQKRKINSIENNYNKKLQKAKSLIESEFREFEKISVLKKITFEERETIEILYKFTKKDIDLMLKALKMYKFYLLKIRIDKSENIKKITDNSIKWSENIKKINELTDEKISITKQEAEIKLIENFNFYLNNNNLVKFLEILNSNLNPSINRFLKNYSLEFKNIYKIWLLNPETISKLFDINDQFDLVIFDEASQMFLERAIPSLKRAKKVIILGDEKQLSPTNFFKSRTIDEKEIEYELEKIKDSNQSLLNFSKSRYPKKMLENHYRSDYADLIQFSNEKFYKNNLKIITRNKDKNIKKPIEYINVENSIFQNGVNKKEANVILKVLEGIKSNPIMSNKKIGIITMNSRQESYIEELIASYESNDRSFSEWLAKRDLFIKNIENVQGDERDIIIFSTLYAPNPEGKQSYNFGPLNQTGGANRINVAITRSKLKMFVISSLNLERFHVFVNNNENHRNNENSGIKILYDYLIFSREISKNAKNKYIINENLNFNSEFEKNIYENIHSKLEKQYNLKITTNYNNLGYEIDLLIYDPKKNKPILIIEADSAMNSSFIPSRERDISRKEFIENRGYNFYRIWSLNWLNNKKTEINKLFKKIDEILKI